MKHSMATWLLGLGLVGPAADTLAAPPDVDVDPSALTGELGAWLDRSLADFEPLVPVDDAPDTADTDDTRWREHQWPGVHASWALVYDRVTGAILASSAPAAGSEPSPALPASVAALVARFGSACDAVATALGSTAAPVALGFGMVDRPLDPQAHATVWQNVALALRCVDGQFAGLVGSWVRKVDPGPVVAASRALKPARGARPLVLGLKAGDGLAAAIDILGPPTSFWVPRGSFEIAEVRWGELVMIQVRLADGAIDMVTVTAPRAAPGEEGATLGAALQARFGAGLPVRDRDAVMQWFDGRWPKDWKAENARQEPMLSPAARQHQPFRRLRAKGHEVVVGLAEWTGQRLKWVRVEFPLRELAAAGDGGNGPDAAGAAVARPKWPEPVTKLWPCVPATCATEEGTTMYALGADQRHAAVAAGARGPAIDALGKAWPEVFRLLGPPSKLDWNCDEVHWGCDEAESDCDAAPPMCLKAAWLENRIRVEIRFEGARMIASRLEAWR